MAISSMKRPALTAGGVSLLLTVSHTANDAFSNILPAFLPILQARFGLTETVLAVFVATISVSANVLQPLFGALSDRLGRRLVGALGVITCSGLLSLVGVAPNPWVLFGLLILGGFGSAAFHPAAGSIIRTGNARNASLGVSLFMAGGPVGSALGPVAVLFVIAQYGIGYTPLLMIPGVLLGLMVYLLTPAQVQAPRGNRPKLFDKQLFFGPVGVLCAVGILRSIAYVTFINAIPLYLVHVQGLARDSVLLGWTLAAFNGAAALGGIVATFLANRYGRSWVIIGSMLMALPFLFGLFFLPPATPLFYVFAAFAGFMTNAGIPLLIVSAQDLAPHAVATASGMLMGLTWGVAGVLYIFIGLLQEAIGIASAMSIGYLFMIPASILAWVLFRRLDASPAD
jgi:FSR family fosmidomycin resistance protein-like MFS transporter